jgi:peptidoglycan hydrolase-like protein with peptidoglycan-binding domain
MGEANGEVESAVDPAADLQAAPPEPAPGGGPPDGADSGASPAFTDVSVSVEPDEGDAGDDQHPHSLQVSRDAVLTLRWSTRNAAGVRIDPLGSFDANGTQQLATEDAELILVPLGDDGGEGSAFPLSVHIHDPKDVVSPHVDLHSGAAEALQQSAAFEAGGSETSPADAGRRKLKAARFRYDVALQACLDGERRILVKKPSEKGRHIRKLQQALIAAGFDLPEFGADGSYGRETASAVSRFKKSLKISPSDGVVGPKTMAALDERFEKEVLFFPPPLQPGDLVLDDFLEALQAAQSANSSDSPEQFLTRLRQLYYPGTDPDGLTLRELGFDQLIPKAPLRLPDGKRRILTAAGMERSLFNRLPQHAPENPTPAKPLDNPSPYLIDATGSRVDIGHFLLLLDALFHPDVENPYKAFGTPSEDVAGWVADVGSAVVWANRDGRDGFGGAPKILPRLSDGQPDFDGYFQMSAPDADLLGDIDGFNLRDLFISTGGDLSTPLVAYYLDGDDEPGLYRRRFRTFSLSFFGTDDPGGGDASALTDGIARFLPRVSRFNDLFADGGAKATLGFDPPPRGTWPGADDAIAKFFQFILDGLKVEKERFD